MPEQIYSQPSPISLGRVYARLALMCHLHFGQNDLAFLRATAVTQNAADKEIRVVIEI